MSFIMYNNVIKQKILKKNSLAYFKYLCNILFQNKFIYNKEWASWNNKRSQFVKIAWNYIILPFSIDWTCITIALSNLSSQEKNPGRYNFPDTQTFKIQEEKTFSPILSALTSKPGIRNGRNNQWITGCSRNSERTWPKTTRNARVIRIPAE